MPKNRFTVNRNENHTQVVEFSQQLSSVGPSTDITQLLALVQSTSSPSKGLWLVSRWLACHSPDQAKPAIVHINKLLDKVDSQEIAAEFVIAHLLAHGFDTRRTVSMPRDIYATTHLFCLITPRTSSRPDFSFLNIDNDLVQRRVAFAIASATAKPANYLRRVLATISEQRPAEVEPLQAPAGPIVKRGLLILAHYLGHGRAPAKEWAGAVFVVWPHKVAQVVLAALIDASPLSVLELTETLLQQPVELEHLLIRAAVARFGVFGVRNLLGGRIASWAQTPSSRVAELTAAAGGLRFLDPAVHKILVRRLVEDCSLRPLDEHLHVLAATAIVAFAPVVPPDLGAFLLVARPRALALLQSTLQPSFQPTRLPLTETIPRQDQLVQATPVVVDAGVECIRDLQEVGRRPPVFQPPAPSFNPIPFKPEIPSAPKTAPFRFQLDLTSPPDPKPS